MVSGLGVGATALAEYAEALVDVSMGADVDHVGGTSQDALYGVLDVKRRVATKSRVTATLTGVNGTGVPAGSRAQTSTGNDVFETLADVLLTPSGIDVEMESVEAGPIEAATDTLTRIVTVIAGWETITNAQAAAQGIARQDDADFRSTYMTRTAHSSVGSMSALEAALSEAESKKINISENAMNTAQVDSGMDDSAAFDSRVRGKRG